MDELSSAKPQELRLPIGIDDYKKVIDESCFYVDKTLLIKEFLEKGSGVLLVTRPRRFGKTIALSMLRYFFEKPVSAKTDQSTAYLFEKSNIWKEEKYRNIQGTFPVIFISFKSVKHNTWEESYAQFKSILKNEVDRTLTPLVKKLLPAEKKEYKQLMDLIPFSDEAQSLVSYIGSLKFISKVYFRIYKKNTIMLIDEYDTPVTYSYIHGFHKELIKFMSALLSEALKGNDYMHKSFLTGVVRTAKDGILSGLNNPTVYTMTYSQFGDKFGFTESETDYLLEKAGYLDKREELKSWYNGYVIGEEKSSQVKVYNPWSVLCYVENFCAPKPYWARTGSVELLERLIKEADEPIQKELKLLMEGHVLENKRINENVILLDLDRKTVEPWSFLFFAGYVTAINHTFRDDLDYYTLAIPNKEIAKLYNDLVLGALNQTVTSDKLLKLMEALISGRVLELESLLKEFILSLCSFYDLPHNDIERSLHMFVLGLLASLSERYVIKSNLESGIGRYDVSMHPKRIGDLAVVIEFKKGQDTKKLEKLSSEELEKELNKLSDEALKQIKIAQYESNLRDFGYKGKVLCYGIACFRKHLVAKMEISYVN